MISRLFEIKIPFHACKEILYEIYRIEDPDWNDVQIRNSIYRWIAKTLSGKVGYTDEGICYIAKKEQDIFTISKKLKKISKYLQISIPCAKFLIYKEGKSYFIIIHGLSILAIDENDEKLSEKEIDEKLQKEIFSAIPFWWDVAFHAYRLKESEWIINPNKLGK